MAKKKAELTPEHVEALSSIEQRVLDAVRAHPGSRASDIGQRVWGRPNDRKGIESWGWNKYCRATGAVLRRLEKRGLVLWEGVYCGGGKGYVSWFAK